ncbi:MAG: GDSL-type esterase/lipase family protein [Flavisolibacter sp.]
MKGITILLGICLFIQSVTSFAQTKVIVLGSSTAAGYGASVPDSAWVARLQTSFRKDQSDGKDTSIDNRGVPGYVTYQSLPTGYPTPPNRPLPDPNANTTYVLSSNPLPQVVIINYPTNDIVDNYTPKEMMDNLRYMFQQLSSNGIRTYITTTQPRNSSTDDAQRTLLRQLVDSIQINFGNYAINFWDDLVTNDGTNMLRADLTPDGTHPNDQGHRYLFQRVQAKNIFSVISNSPLPVILQNWQTRLDNNVVRLSWHTVNEQAGCRFEIERSADGNHFTTLQSLNGTGHDGDYSWTDASPLKGKSFYRLKMVTQGQTSYASILPMVIDEKSLITSLYVEGSILHIQTRPAQDHAVIEIINSLGAIMKKQNLTSVNNSISIPISAMPAGDYFLRITVPGSKSAVERFTKLK